MKNIIWVLFIALLFVGCSKEATTEVAEIPDEVTSETTEDVTKEVETEVVTEEASAEEVVEPFIVDPNSLRGLAEAKGMFVGTAISLNYFNQDAYVNIVKNEFNAIVMENMMKWESMNPNQDQYVFIGVDVASKFAQDHGMAMRGHTLIWHQQLPQWLTRGEWTKEELLGVVDGYVENMVGHFKGKIHTWDVLNEIFEEDGSFRQSIWYEITGEDYIRLALKKAREMDPDAKLIINDYNVETINPKSDGLYNLVKKLQEEGVPIDGVGFQCHFIADQIDYDSLIKNIERFEALGLEVQLTEIDLRMASPVSQESLEAQGEAYKRLMEIALDHNIKVFMVWGVSDNVSWVPGFFAGYSTPLLFDNKYQKKPAYDGLIEALKE